MIASQQMFANDGDASRWLEEQGYYMLGEMEAGMPRAIIHRDHVRPGGFIRKWKYVEYEGNWPSTIEVTTSIAPGTVLAHTDQVALDGRWQKENDGRVSVQIFSTKTPTANVSDPEVRRTVPQTPKKRRAARRRAGAGKGAPS